MLERRNKEQKTKPEKATQRKKAAQTQTTSHVP